MELLFIQHNEDVSPIIIIIIIIIISIINISISISIIFNLRTAVLRLIVRSGLDVTTFATRRLHACHHTRAPSGGRWDCGREMSENFA